MAGPDRAADDDGTTSFDAAVWEDAPSVGVRLYVAGSSPSSARAVVVTRRLLDTAMRSRWSLEVVDVYLDPHRVVDDGILAVPTLMRVFPPPRWMVTGELSEERVLERLGLTTPIRPPGL